jgi:hypothetical protein
VPLNSFLFINPLHPAGEGKGEGVLKSFPPFYLPLREKTKVRGLLNSSFFFLLHPWERVRARALLKTKQKNQNKYPSALKYLISLPVSLSLILPVTLRIYSSQSSSSY